MNTCYCNPVPKFKIKEVEINGHTATITIDGTLPAFGRFDVCGKIYSEYLCSPACIIFTDGITTVPNVINCYGNPVLFGEFALQVNRYGVVHACHSKKYSGNLITVLDKICSPYTQIEVVTATTPPVVDSGEFNAKTADEPTVKTAAVKKA